ncbi:MAG: hypothetical protein U5K36_11590 [Roseovarius sp.]|nr:hypothetical protein [Roseovarius sp.]
MFEAFLANTSAEGLRPLGTAPQRSFELITGTVREKFGDRHAALFAEPVAAQHGNRFDWYATAPGTPVPLADLPEDEAEVARATLESLERDIRGMAGELLDSSDPGDQRLGEALANALEIPGEDAIRVLRSEGAAAGDPVTLQPVLVNWAWVRDEQTSLRGALTGIDRRPAPRGPAALQTASVAPAAAGAATARPGGLFWWWLLWLGWALLAVMIALIILLLIRPCALRLPFLPDNCPRDAVQPVTPEEERRLLEDRIHTLERRIASADRACQPDPAALTIPDLPPPSEAQAEPQIDERAAQAGAVRGDLTFTIIWDGSDDLDLHVTCPTGETLYFMKTATCNGRLDVDSNAQEISPNPIENAHFSDPQPGTYRVRINHYKVRSGTDTRAFTLQINDHGRVSTHRGRVTHDQPDWQHDYQYKGQ